MVGLPRTNSGNALGLGHERQNPAGGMPWNDAVVIRDLSGPPLCWTAEHVRRFMLTTMYGIGSTSGTRFDPDSIMLDFFPPEWTLNGIGVMANTALSNLDKQLIAKMYPKR